MDDWRSRHSRIQLAEHVRQTTRTTSFYTGTILFLTSLLDKSNGGEWLEVPNFPIVISLEAKVSYPAISIHFFLQ
jgi:hypothetical protein